MLIVIAFIANSLSYLLTDPLIEEFFVEQQAWVGELLRSAVQSALMLIFFILFIILGVREVTTPVLRLSRVAERIAQGEYDVEIPQTRRRDEIGTLERSFAAMAKELGSTQYMQKDFVSNVSHEYKTPLAVMSGYTRLLAKDDLPPEERAQYCGFIQEEITRLSHMTTNILLLSKLEHQGIMPRMEAFSLDEQLRQAALLFLGGAQAKEIDLEVNLCPVVIRGNEELMMHVWTNLLENAVKFTDAGGTVAVRAEAVDGTATVSVSDTGMGMDEETAARIFDQFYQGDTSRQGAGSGLGLSLAYRVAQLHGGTIQVDSEPGQGATFRVTLPYPTVQP